MSLPAAQPTSYPDINAVLNLLHHRVQSILGDQLYGLYLYGSLASGDFNPQTSDIDFLVVTHCLLTNDIVTALESMHKDLLPGSSKWAAKLEGTYLAVGALRHYDPYDTTAWPTLNEGNFFLAPHGWDWVLQRQVLRQNAVIVAGPPVHDLIDPVEPDDIRQAVRGILKDWWEPMLVSPGRIKDSEYQAYTVLTMCRSLYALRNGEMVSKPAAAHWALIELDGRWKELIWAALAWRPGLSFDRLPEILDFIRYTL